MLDRTPPHGFRDRLADVVLALRPDSEVLHVRAALERAEQREPIVTLAQYAAAAINVATDRTWRSPHALAYDGPHWPHGTQVGRSPDPGPPCRECGRPERQCRAADARVDPIDRHEYEATPMNRPHSRQCRRCGITIARTNETGLCRDCLPYRKDPS